MDRITHQSRGQRGYGSTSSLRNDSLKHTQKHERRREESNQETKLPGSGGLSGQAGRTVRKGHEDCPAGYRGLSAPLPRTVRSEPRTVLKRQQNLQRRTANNGPSAGSTRTVRGEHADCPPGTRGLSAQYTRTVRNLAQPKLETTTDRKQTRARTRRTRDEHARRGPFARSTRTVRKAWTEQKTARPRKSTLPIHHRISQTVEAVETRVWGHEKNQPRMLYPKNFTS
jgi:hypothetical protein